MVQATHLCEKNKTVLMRSSELEESSEYIPTTIDLDSLCPREISNLCDNTV